MCKEDFFYGFIYRIIDIFKKDKNKKKVND